MKLTDRQQQLLDALRQDERQSIRELQARCGISSTSVVAWNVRRLADLGYLDFGPQGTSRAIRVRRPDVGPLVERAKVWRHRDPELDRLIREWEQG